MLGRLAKSGLLLALPLLAACGSTSGPVLERVKEPPGSNVRVDVLLVRDVESCAIGDVCRAADIDQCFTMSDAAGARLAFRPETVLFVPPDSPEIQLAEQASCFRLTIDTQSRAAIQSGFDALRQQAFQLSDGEILLDLHVHDLGPIDAGFKRWEGKTGIFLQPTALEQVGFPVVSRETDYVYSVTGSADLDFGLAPKVEECAGTNWLDKGGFGGASYTWVSAPCAVGAQLLWHFLAQSYFALRDIVHFPNLYGINQAGGEQLHRYPACGRATADPQDWFPLGSECFVDPDSATCGSNVCSTAQGSNTFVRHLLTEHWPKEPDMVGNHCRNGEEDFDEFGPDMGGVCDLIGR
jgi:hypothetical protein